MPRKKKKIRKYDPAKRRERYLRDREKILKYRRKYHKKNRDRENSALRAAYDPAKRRARYLAKKQQQQESI